MSHKVKQIYSLLKAITIPSEIIEPSDCNKSKVLKVKFNKTPLWVRTLNNLFCGVVNDTYDLPFMLNKAVKKSNSEEPILIQKVMRGRTLCILSRVNDEVYSRFDIFGVNFLSGMYRVPYEYWTITKLSPQILLGIQEIFQQHLSKLTCPKGWLQIELIKGRKKWYISFLSISKNIDKSLLEIRKLKEKKGEDNRIYFLKWIIPPSGVIEKITGIDSALKTPGVEKIKIKLTPGETIKHISDTTSRDKTGYIITSGNTLRSAIFSSTKALQLLKIHTTNLFL
ncbi:MAG: hypothetical protein N3G21_10290 [Candidatus Hydrogenedentes bacterium]|nr:hypothetical protein [Candidatus Hydrogenedentota bacterium]